ncbi:MAG: hemolysin III family protein, partial [Bacteroidota bacterium]
LGFVLSLIGVGLLGMEVLRPEATPWHITGAWVYGGALVFLYAASTLFHSVRGQRLKFVFQVIDHVAIFVMIAGSYTPFALVVLRDAMGWTMLGLAWSIALVGIVYKICSSHRFKALSTLLYVAMGWMAVLFLEPLFQALPAAGIWWLVAGGLSYTVGVVFFVWERLPFSHAIWHVFVLIGSVCHFVVIWKYVLALP